MTNEVRLISSNTKEKAVLLDNGGFCPSTADGDERECQGASCADCIAEWLQKEEEKK